MLKYGPTGSCDQQSLPLSQGAVCTLPFQMSREKSWWRGEGGEGSFAGKFWEGNKAWSFLLCTLSWELKIRRDGLLTFCCLGWFRIYSWDYLLMPAFLITPHPPAPKITTKQQEQQTFLKRFFAGSCAAGLTLRGKQKTLVAGQLESLTQYAPYLHATSVSRFHSEKVIYMVLASLRRSSDLGTGCFCCCCFSKQNGLFVSVSWNIFFYLLGFYFLSLT